MAWKIGDWKILGEGKVHQVLKKCINILLKNQMQIVVKFLDEHIKIENGKEVYEILRDFEKLHGVNDLLEVLLNGLNLECGRNSETIEIKVLMRTPSESEEHKKLFMDMIVAWVDQSYLTFSERFFRLPKITEDIADRYLDNPLEKTLNKTFGFNFNYKIIIECKKETPALEVLRKKIYQVMR